ncbi:MAG: tRNA (adenosine(37)-N6)-dimethylallyltransferase MiaA [Flavobacteriaceae bacterium]|nr:tRNA (adenosine(37)-N6)-dimethylallyltransferase MiaA [Flavobacteriaceae bacterium]
MQDADTPVLICVVGPTAIGKTSLSIKLATAFGTEIIAADSRQFYKEMEIGTAVPSRTELEAATHHFVQHKSIFESYSVGDFERDVIELLDNLFQKHQVLVMVGGSGLYVDAVAKGLDTFPAVPPVIREQLNTELEHHGVTVLQQELRKVDPDYYQKVDIHNPHRLIRALEIYRATGHPYSSFLNKNSSKRNFKTVYVGLTAPREIIYDRINTRVDQMIADGLEDEAHTLYPHRHLNALQTVGYKELFSYFDGEISREQAISEIKKNTRRFAKRQGTWFRKNEAITWFDYDAEFSEVISEIKAKNAL